MKRIKTQIEELIQDRMQLAEENEVLKIRLRIKDARIQELEDYIAGLSVRGRPTAQLGGG